MPVPANETEPAVGASPWPARVAVALLGLLLAAAIVRLAWLCDDAFITFRCVENTVAGRGPVWNADERVQAFTHPLWFGVLCLLRLFTGELPTSTMWLGVAVTLVAAAWLVRLSADAWAGAALLLCLLASRAFGDYATSGLENPLVHLLLAALMAAHGRADPVRRLRGVAVATGLLALTRLDLLVLCAPVGIAALRGVPWRTAVRAVAVGAAAPLAWSTFAAVYYGSPFPITAWAKAFAPGLPAGELFAKGVHFLAAHVAEDPASVTVVALGVVAGFATRGHRALALGVVLQLAYITRVGGDYMLGRFLTPLVTVGALLLVTGAGRRGRPWLAGAAALVVGAAATFGVPMPLRSIAEDVAHAAVVEREDELSDERRYYFAATGLWSPHRYAIPAGFHSARMREQGDTAVRYEVVYMVGGFAYLNGDLIHVVDACLLDPFLMRLPVGDLDDWRIGHYFRRIPAGYLESLATGENRLVDPRLARLWDAVRSVTRDPIWSAARWRNVWTLWTGGLRDDVAAYVAERYRTPPRTVVPLDQLAAPVEPGTPWYRHAPSRSCAGGGLAVTLPAATAAAAVELHLSGVADYVVELWHRGQRRHTVPLRVDAPPVDGFVALTVPVPAAVAAIDEVRVTCPAAVSFPVAPFLGRIDVSARR